MLSAAIGGVCPGITCQRPSRSPTGDFEINKNTLPFYGSQTVTGTKNPKCLS